ncbi:hypothetical protein JT358_08645 [Micrococcales bacterium 31B]|nr:hypothetical protein [Micrococcales bacterium 31B]
MTWIRERSITVPAPRDDVWGVISNLAAWPALLGEFNNLVPSEGQLRAGGAGTFTIAGLKAAAHLIAPGTFYIRHFAPGQGVELVLQAPRAQFVVGFALDDAPLDAPVAGSAAPLSGPATVLTQTLHIEGVTERVVRPVAERLDARLDVLGARILGQLGGVAESRGLKVVIAGESGDVATRLAARAALRGHRPVLLLSESRPDLPFAQAYWNGTDLGGWVNEVREQPGRTVLVNLTADAPAHLDGAAPGVAAEGYAARGTHSLIMATRQCHEPLRGWVQLEYRGAHAEVPAETHAPETPADERPNTLERYVLRAPVAPASALNPLAVVAAAGAETQIGRGKLGRRLRRLAELGRTQIDPSAVELWVADVLERLDAWR